MSFSAASRGVRRAARTIFASSSRTCRFLGPPGRVIGRSPIATPNTSLSECAGSIEISSTLRDTLVRARRRAVAAAAVVLPTPPLPPKSSSLCAADRPGCRPGRSCERLPEGSERSRLLACGRSGPPACSSAPALQPRAELGTNPSERRARPGLIWPRRERRGLPAPVPASAERFERSSARTPGDGRRSDMADRQAGRG